MYIKYFISAKLYVYILLCTLGITILSINIQKMEMLLLYLLLLMQAASFMGRLAWGLLSIRLAHP